ncbi:hypothetical protein [Luteolibacter luteus]|jgi:hypothetical protein|uniref:Uncharacterized protein n=1 Tax=Luteolibacter luteus TaxID=2728835 RepID=A0A858RHA1_9BACT|nr:hypothetical protein [Luteolibacter luteus]QJE96546.1 hypothetical protein HHL09_12390 [Luteolibacter luteus]
MDAMHLYERLPLFGTGIVLGVWLIALHALLLAKPVETQGFLKRFPRNQQLGQILLALGLIWFWLLVAPPGKGILHSLSMDLGEFNGLKKYLRYLVPISIVAVGMAIKEFLAVRALGLLGLLVAAPLLEAAFLKDPGTRLLIPIFAFVVVIKSLYWVGMPYLFRDAVTWATANQKRWQMLCFAGLGYGVAVLACAFLFWKGY